jgi:hypothetical protein
MFSNKYDLNVLEVKSAAITALQATIAYFGLTIVSFYEKIMSGDFTYLLSVVGFFGVTFGVKLVQKYLRSGEDLNKTLAREIMGQEISPQDKE